MPALANIFPKFCPLTKKVALAPLELSISRIFGVKTCGPSSNVRAMVPGTLHRSIYAPNGTALLLTIVWFCPSTAGLATDNGEHARTARTANLRISMRGKSKVFSE
jgi:hypothetical protein